MALESFNAYHSYLDTMEALNDAECGRLFRALLEYSATGAAPELRGNERFVFPGMRSQIDRDIEKYNAKCARNRENGEKGGGQLPPNAPERPRTPPKDKDKDKDKDGFSASSNEDVCPSDDGRGDVQTVIDAWNSLGLNPIRGVAPGSTRKQILGGRLNQDGLPLILQAIENVRSSAFLNGQNNRGFTATFDWFIKPSNFQKVLDGNYNNRRNPVPTSTADRLAQMIEEGVFGD